jgi:hypothetical protein
LADPDVWLRLAKRDDGASFYEYLLVYTDNLLAIAINPKSILDNVNLYFNLKPESVGHPNIYLGSKISKAKMANGVESWCNSSCQYVKEAIKNTEAYPKKTDGKMLRGKTRSPMETNYRPELDVTTALGPLKANYYQSQIAVLRWIVELGRMDICTEVSMLASHNALPQTGHLDAVFRIFSYLKTKTNARLVLDPTYPEIDYDSFKKQNWSKFYGDAKERMPGNAPTAHGKPVEIRCYVDADHAGDKLTRKSQSGIVIFLNQAPTVWYSKKQNTVETSTFGSEFVALKVAAEMLRGQQYKLRMMGVPNPNRTLIRIL